MRLDSFIALLREKLFLLLIVSGECRSTVVKERSVLIEGVVVTAREWRMCFFSKVTSATHLSAEATPYNLINYCVFGLSVHFPSFWLL